MPQRNFYIVYILIFLLIHESLTAQFEFKPNMENRLCVEQMEKAESELSANLAIIKLKKSIPFSDTQRRVIEEEFGIKVEYPVPFIENCYNYQLKVLLSEKHNVDFINHTLKIADSIDSSGNGNSNEKLIIEEKSIQEYIQNNLSKKQKRILRKKYGKENLYLTLQIDVTGKSWCYSFNRLELDVSKSIPQNAKSGEQFIEPIIYALVNGKKLYRPRIRNGIPVKTMQMVRLNF